MRIPQFRHERQPWTRVRDSAVILLTRPGSGFNKNRKQHRSRRWGFLVDILTRHWPGFNGYGGDLGLAVEILRCALRPNVDSGLMEDRVTLDPRWEFCSRLLDQALAWVFQIDKGVAGSARHLTGLRCASRGLARTPCNLYILVVTSISNCLEEYH